VDGLGRCVTVGVPPRRTAWDASFPLVEDCFVRVCDVSCESCRFRIALLGVFCTVDALSTRARLARSRRAVVKVIGPLARLVDTRNTILPSQCRQALCC
jgi:hypothetical protein